MSDFSLFSLFTAGLACLVPLTAAYTKPVGDSPSGNPISQPGLNSVVPAGENFTITWNPTTDGTVTLVLLKGPSSNAVPQYAIVEEIENSGSYVWEVKSNTAPSENAQGYGIQLIDDETGAYQYTTQFGISNPDYDASSDDEEPKSSSSVTRHGGPKSYPTKAPRYTAFTTYCSEETTLTYGHQTYTVTEPGTVTLTYSRSAPHATGTGASWSMPASNVTMVAPTGYAPSMTRTTAASSSATGASATFESSPAGSTGAASSFGLNAFGLVAAAGVVVLAI